MANCSGRKSQLAVFLATAFIALLIFGCGGGGGTSSTSSTASTSGATGGLATTDIALNAFFLGTKDPASPFVTGSSGAANYQLIVGDQVQIYLIGVFTNTDVVSQVQATNFRITSPYSVATINSSGLLVGKSAAPSSQYQVSAEYQGTTYSASFQVINPTAKVAGTVEDTSTNPVQGVLIDFYDSSGTLLAQTQTGSDGTFIGNVPTTAVSYAADATALTEPKYFNEYDVNTSVYAPTIADCFTPLSGLSLKEKKTLPYTIIVIPNDSSNLPPLPTGCGG
jgi:hypothetical protein